MSPIHPLAVIGEPPQHRDYLGKPVSVILKPQIDATARIEALAQVDSGTVEPTRVGARTYLMKGVHVGHDAQVGADCEIAVGAVLCGHVVLEDGVRIGVNASILPFRRVGAGARVGAGSVVTHDVPPGEVWAGVPAKRLAPKPMLTGMKNPTLAPATVDLALAVDEARAKEDMHAPSTLPEAVERVWWSPV